MPELPGAGESGAPVGDIASLQYDSNNSRTGHPSQLTGTDESSEPAKQLLSVQTSPGREDYDSNLEEHEQTCLKTAIHHQELLERMKSFDSQNGDSATRGAYQQSNTSAVTPKQFDYNRTTGKDAIKMKKLQQQFQNLSLDVKGKVQAWRIRRSQIELGQKLGEGMVGVIYEAKWRGSTVAVKCLREGFVQETQECKDLIQEVTILSVLRHPNLVQFLGATADTANTQAPPMIVYELMQGGSLEDLFKNKTLKHGFWKPPREMVWAWSKDLFRALAFLHQSKPPLVHRDIKPANLLLSKDLMTLKVGDFGLCKAIKEGHRKMTGDTGTKRYMAPEVHNKDPNYTCQVDIYSGALILWLINAGMQPYANLNVNIIGQATSLEHVRPPLAVVGWVEIRDLISRAWSPKATDRPNAQQVLDELEVMRGAPGTPGYTEHRGCKCVVS